MIGLGCVCVFGDLLFTYVFRFVVVWIALLMFTFVCCVDLLSFLYFNCVFTCVFVVCFLSFGL